MKPPKPPAHLGEHGAELFERLAADYHINDSGGLALLVCAAESLDRVRQAQSAIESDGAIIKDRYGCPKSHPACILERDAKNQFLQALKALKLEISNETTPE